jgi:uncharacterized membrane protein SpoIIM required for sporulation
MTSNPDDALQRWLERRAGDWQALEEQLRAEGRTTEGREPGTPRDTLWLVEALHNVSRDVSLARRIAPDGRLMRYLRGLYLGAHDAVYRRPRGFGAQMRETLRDGVPAVVHALRYRLLAVAALFVASGAIGWWLVASYPELASLFASEQMIAQVQRGQLWTEGMFNIMPSSLASLRIMTNNIVVSLTAFVLGAFYGLGTLYIIGLNGLMLGATFAFTARHGLAGQLGEFVVAHGIVELSAICLAGAAGVGLGEALMRPGSRPRSEAFQVAVRQGGQLLLMGVLFLIGAGVIEGYISADAGFGIWGRLTIGVAYFVVFVLVLTGGLWRWPTRRPGRG